MLACKTTCKNGWRQIPNEADRVEKRQLLILQEGVSFSLYREMAEAGVFLVVPKPLHHAYPDEVRRHIVSVSQFIEEIQGFAGSQPR